MGISYFYQSDKEQTPHGQDFAPSTLASIYLCYYSTVVFFSFFYSLRFTAKAIASIESRSEAHFANYFAYLVAMFFFPIGIWWIQPKVNRILKGPIRETEVATE